MANIERVCSDLCSNKSLMDVFVLILELGNLLNAGSYAGNARGFRLSALPKLLDTRANKPPMTFLHYVVQLCAEQPGGLDFIRELAQIHAVSAYVFFLLSL